MSRAKPKGVKPWKRDNGARAATAECLSILESRPTNSDRGIRISDADLFLCVLWMRGFKIVPAERK